MQQAATACSSALHVRLPFRPFTVDLGVVAWTTIGPALFAECSCLLYSPQILFDDEGEHARVSTKTRVTITARHLSSAVMLHEVQRSAFDVSGCPMRYGMAPPARPSRGTFQPL